LKAGKTEIVGNAGWQAIAATTESTGTVVIGADAADEVTTITGAAGVALTALGDGTSNPTITQTAGSGNNLIIAADTTIALGGTSSALGQLILNGNASNPGKITLTNETSVVSTGNVAAASAWSSAATIGGKTPKSVSVVITTTNNNAAGDFAKMDGTDGSKVLEGSSSDPVTIDGSQAVA
jgi:hypothetical protein